MSSSAMRRVLNYPADWWLLSERDLEALSWARWRRAGSQPDAHSVACPRLRRDV